VRKLPSIKTNFTPLETNGYGSCTQLVSDEGTMIAEKTGVDADTVYTLQGEAMELLNKQ